MTCNFCAVALPTLCFLQNPTFAFKRTSATEKADWQRSVRPLWPAAVLCPSRGGQRAPVLRTGLPASWKFIHFTQSDPPPHLQKAAASDLIGGSADPRRYRAQPCCGHFIAWGDAGGPAPPGDGRARVPGRPRRAVHGGEGRQRSAHRFLVLPFGSEAPPAEPRPGPSPSLGAIGGCRAGPGRHPRGGLRRAGRVREERARRRRRCCLLRGAGRQRGPGSRARRAGGGPGLGIAAAAGQAAFRSGGGWAAERAGRGKGQAPPPRWAMEWGSAARGRWPVAAAAAAAETACFWKVRARLAGGERPAGCLSFWQPARGTVRTGGRREASERACVCIGGEERVPLGGRRQWEVPRWRGGRVGAVKGGFAW